MRYLFGFLCVCALGMPLAGCSDPVGTPCDDVEDCVGDSCREGQELFCNLMDLSRDFLGVCDCKGTGGTGGTGGGGGAGGSGASDCSDVTPGNGEFGAPCRNDGDCLGGLPCCTSTEVSEACGVQVGLCECI